MKTSLMAQSAGSETARALKRSLTVGGFERFGIQGHVNLGFESLRQAFSENFTRRRELGGACCAFVRGEKVVDLWGGIRNKQTGEPWEENTTVIVHSATKSDHEVIYDSAAALARARRLIPDFEGDLVHGPVTTWPSANIEL
jgi:hypothetical protein